MAVYQSIKMYICFFVYSIQLCKLLTYFWHKDKMLYLIK